MTRRIVLFALFLAVASIATAAPCPDPEPLPHDVGTALASVRQTLAAGRPGKALSKLDAAMAGAGALRHPYPSLLRGQILLSMGRPAEAETALMEALKRDPCAEAGWRNLAAARHAQHRPGPAAEATERALELSDDLDGELRYQAAGFHLAAGNPGRAISHLEPLARRKRPRAEWLSSLGDAYEQAGRMENAADAYARAVRIRGAAENRYRAGRAWLAAGKPGKAAEALAPLARMEKGRAEWFLALGHAMERIGKKSQAGDAFARAFQASGDFDAGLRAALLWLEGENRDGAVPLLRELAKRKKLSTDRARNLGGALAQAGLPGEAARVQARVAGRTGMASDRYSAALLFLNADQARDALPLLEALAKTDRPKTDWLGTLAATLEKLDQPGEAAAAWARAFRRTANPDHALRAAALHRKAGKNGNALEILAELPEDAEIPEEWGTLRADLLAAEGRFAEAARALETRPDFGKRPTLRHRAATFWERSGRSEKAAALLRSLADRPDAKPEWRSDLARLLVRTGATEEAEALMAGDDGAADAGSSTEMMEVRVDWLLETERTAEALPLLRKLAQQPGAAPQWRIALAETLLETGDPDAAVEAAEAVEGSESDALSPAEIHRLTAFWLRLDRPSEALSVLEAGLEAGNSAESHEFLRVRALAALERWEAVDAVLARLRERRPDDPSVWTLCARIGVQRGRFQEAAADLALAYRLSPPPREEWRRLGDLYARAGVHRKAAETYQRAFGDSPVAAELDLLAKTWKQARDLDAARKAAEAAAVSEPTRARWAFVGNLSLAMRDFKGAQEAFVRAAALDDPDGEMSYWAGYAAWREGNFDAAKASLERAMIRAEENGRIIAKARQLLKVMG
ncbi:MAG: tetratricopeptide repeat protein [Desulfococcaceae bacterium]